MDNLNPLVSGAQRFGITLSKKQLLQFDKYQLLLREWNQRINLTAIYEYELIQERLFLDSLTCVLATGELSSQRMIDVGSGAGFPGIPLKICFADLKLTLLESIGKKIRFLQTVVDALDLTNVAICAGRAEEFGQATDHREAYDWAVARAVAPLRILSEYLLPLVQVQGHALAQKGQDAKREVLDAERAILVLGGGPVDLIPVNVAGQDQPSYLVKVRKVLSTPAKYPRRIGVPAKRPL